MWVVAALLLLAPLSAQAERHVNVAVIGGGSINPASSDYLQRAIARSEEEGAAMLVIQLDTPGGLLTATKDIIQAILEAEVPVAVYVSPRGAWAASAGTFITMAAHVAAMAPGTTIGAAHPVSIGGGGSRPAEGEEDEGARRDYAAEKAENLVAAFVESIARERERNVEWAIKAVRESVAISQDRALELNVIDLVAVDVGELLQKADGMQVSVRDEETVLQVAGAELRVIEMRPLTRVLDVLASPNLIVILFLAGLAGLYIEANQPGMIVPGVAGAVCLVLAAIGLQIIPFSWVGLLLMLAGLGFFVAELFVTSYGILFALGIGAFLLGGSMLFDRPEMPGVQVSFWSVLVPAVGTLSVLMAIAIYAIGRTFGRRQTAGVDEMVGLVGTATTPLEPAGTVFVRGEYWRATAEGPPVAQGDRIEVIRVEGLSLRVRQASPREGG